MAIDRPRAGLTIVRICIGIFFIAEGLGKWRWFTDTSLLSHQLSSWLQAAPAGSLSRWYLEHVAMRGTAVFARLVPLGEISCGLAMLVGFWASAAALIAFFMALSFHVASGAIVHIAFLSNGYGLPVLGATLAVAVGGVRLPWSVR
jgi:uncharacterized membrane protein YphA (DoxX/SURF4 family)